MAGGSGTLKGITIEIEGDVSNLKKSFDDLTSQSRALSREMAQAEKALALDPTNVELLAQKERYAAQQTDVLERKLKLVSEALKSQDVRQSAEAFDYLQRELAYTNDALAKLGGTADGVDLGWLKEGAGLALGEDVVDAAKQLASSVIEYAEAWDTASARVAAAVGSDAEAGERLTEVGRALYSEGWGGSLDELTSSLISVREVLGDLSEEDMSAVTRAVLTMEGTFGADATESLRGVNVLVERFGLSATEACDLMVAGMQRGLDYTDELGDNLSEYAGRWADAGMSATQYFSLLQAGVDAGAYSLDKVGDFLNEFLTSLSDGRMESNIGSFSASTQALWESYKAGGATAQDMLNAVVGELRDCESETEALSVASDTWSSLGEDNALSVITALADVSDSYRDTAGAAEDAAQSVEDGLSQRLEAAKRKLLDAVEPIASAFLDVASGALDALEPLIDGFNNMSDAQKVALAVSTVLVAALPKAVTMFKALKTAVMAAKTAQLGLNAAMKASAAGLAVVAITAVVGIVEDLRERAEEAAERADDLAVAYGGVEEALARIDAGGLSDAADAADAAADSLGNAADRAASLRAQMEEGYDAALDSVGEAADRFAASAEAIASVDASNDQLQGYVDVIQELADKGDLTESEMSQLETAVRRYNEITGESVTITDRQNGTLSESAEAIEDVAQAYMDMAKAQAFQNELTGLYETQIEQTRQLETATHDWAEAQVAMWEQVYGDDLAERLDVSRDQLVELTAAEGDLVTAFVEQLTPSIDSYTGSIHQGNQETEDCAAALSLAEQTMGVYQGELDGTNASIAYFEGALAELTDGEGDAAEGADAAADAADGLGDSAEGAAGAVGALGDAMEGTLKGTYGATDAASAAEGAFADMSKTAEGAAASVESAFYYANREGADISSLTREVNEALQEAGVTTDDLTESEMLLAYQTGMTGDEMIDYARGIQEARDAQEEADEAAREAAEAVEELHDSMAELVAESPRLADAVKATGLGADGFADALDAAGSSVDEFRSRWEGLADAANPLAAITQETGVYTWQMAQNLQSNASTVSQWTSGISELYGRVTNEKELAFAQYVESMGADNLEFLHYLLYDADVSFSELADMYAQSEQTQADGAVAVTQAAADAAARVGAEATEAGAQAVAEGAQDAAGQATEALAEGIESGSAETADAADVLGEATMDALMDLPSEMEARGNAAGGYLAVGLAEGTATIAPGMAATVEGALAQLDALEGGMAEAGARAGEALSAPVLDALSSFASEMLQKGDTGGSAFASGVSVNSEYAATAGGELASAVTGALSSLASDLLQKGDTCGSAFGTGVYVNEEYAGQAGGALASAVTDALSSFASEMLQAGTDGGSAFLGGISSTVAADAGSGLASAVTGGLDGLNADMQQAGALLAASFCEGVNANVEVARDGGLALASAAVAGTSGAAEGAVADAMEASGANAAAAYTDAIDTAESLNDALLASNSLLTQTVSGVSGADSLMSDKGKAAAGAFTGGVGGYAEIAKGSASLLATMASTGASYTSAGEVFYDVMVARGKSGGSAFSTSIGTDENVAAVKSSASSLASAAEEALSSLGPSAYAWGSELGGNFAAGIASQMATAALASQSVAGSVSSYLHFSEPEKGPLVGINDSGAEMVSNYAASMLSAVPLLSDAANSAALAARFGAEAVPAALYGGGSGAPSASAGAGADALTQSQVYDAVRAAIRSAVSGDGLGVYVDGKRLVAATAGEMNARLGALQTRGSR